MTKKTLIVLSLIFILGFLLRIYHLGNNYPPLYSDEVGGNYFYWSRVNNSSTSKVSQNIRGVITSPISISWLFGFSTLVARIPAAINGSVLIIAMFFFVVAITKNITLGEMASLLIALSPWSFLTSRLYGNIPFVTTLILLHLVLYIKAINIRTKLVSIIPLVMSTYYYPSMIIIFPFVILPVLFDLWNNLSNGQRRAFSLFTILSLAILVFFAQLRFHIFDSSSRGLDLAIWRDVNVTADSNLYRGLARLSEPTIFSFYQDPEKIANKIVFNYPISVLSSFTKNYLSFFSPDFLFLKGDNILRHSTGMVGNFYPFLLPFMVYGCFLFFRDATKRNRIIFATWILASPLPAAITKDGASYLLRVVTLMPFLTYFCALGIVSSFEFFKNNFSKIVYGIILSFIALFSAYYYFYGYFHVYPALSANSFEYGFKELSDFQVNNPGKMLIIWEDKYPYTHFCFWQNISYEFCEYIKTNTRITVGQSRLDLPLPNVIFSLPQSNSDLALIINRYVPKHLVLPSKYQKIFPELSNNHTLIETIKNPDLSTAFEIYEIK